MAKNKNRETAAENCVNKFDSPMARIYSPANIGLNILIFFFFIFLFSLSDLAGLYFILLQHFVRRSCAPGANFGHNK